MAVEPPKAKLKPEEAVKRPVPWSRVRRVLLFVSLIRKMSRVWEAEAWISTGKVVKE